MKHARSDAGFTLVEALVSLFVFSLIAMGGVGILYQSVESQRYVGDAQASLRELQTTRALLASDAAQLALRPSRQANGPARPPFVGGDADLAMGFVRAFAEPDEQRGGQTMLSYVEYVVDKDGRVLRRSRTDIDAGEKTETAERVLLSNAKNAHFEFYDGLQWRTQWLASVVGEPPPRAIALLAELPRFGVVRLEVLVGL